MVEDIELKEHFIKCTLAKTDEEEPVVIEIKISDSDAEIFYDAEIEFDIIRRVTLVEERSITELAPKKEKQA